MPAAYVRSDRHHGLPLARMRPLYTRAHRTGPSRFARVALRSGVVPHPVLCVAELALEWIGRGAQAGNASCQGILAKLPAKGEGVERNRAEALRLARLSANQCC